MSESHLPVRVLVLHKQSTSARVRFLLLKNSVLLFEPLPETATLIPESDAPTLRIHPANAVREATQFLNLAEGDLEAVNDFQIWLSSLEGNIPVLMLACTTIDPPFGAVEPLGGIFIALTETRRQPLLEREVLRLAYAHLLG